MTEREPIREEQRRPPEAGVREAARRAEASLREPLSPRPLESDERVPRKDPNLRAILTIIIGAVLLIMLGLGLAIALYYL